MTPFRQIGRNATLATAAGIFCGLSGALGAEGDAKLEVYGFAQGDYIQDFRRVDPAWDDTLRPTRIPTHPGTFGSDGQAIISARQSRFGAKGSAPVMEKTMKAQFEFDMFGVGVDEGQTTIRLRHAYGEWGCMLGGQTHTLFMDIDAFPNVIDYWGPAGLVFVRNPQLRWQAINSASTYFAVALEKPSNDIDVGQIAGGASAARDVDPALAGGATIQGDEKVPDLTSQVRLGGDWGHVLLGGVLRRVGYETLGTPENKPQGFEVGWGLNLSTNLKLFDRDKVIVAGVYGHGIATYMNDGGVDLAPEGTPGSLSAKAVPLFGVTAYYDRYWSDHWSSSVGYSRTQVENTSFQAGNAFHSGEYASVNLLKAPDPKILYGAELLWGRRMDNDGATGNDVRVQFSFKYSFSGNI